MAKIGRPRLTKRGQSTHPGVILFARNRSGENRWYARWADPDRSRPEPIIGPDGLPLLYSSGRVRTRMKYVWVEQTLDPFELKSASAREHWCKSKSKWLASRAAAVASGEAVTTETTVAKAIEKYFTAKKAELQPSTLVAYKQGSKPFAAWCLQFGVPYIETLTPALLSQYREWFVGRPAFAPAKGNSVGKGTRVVGSRRRSPAQINKCLNGLRVILGQFRREGRLPHFDSDAIVDSLPFVKRERARRRFLDAQQVRALLEACGRHDADGNMPIAPFAAAALLTGMRFNELAQLSWPEVNVQGAEITLSAKRTKTSTERTVRLDKTPSLLAWLSSGKLAARGKGRVFPELTVATARIARARLVGDSDGHYGAPQFTWHRLRATCGTYCVCSSLYGRGSEHETARQLGHSIQVAQTHYTGRVKDCIQNAASLESAYDCVSTFDAAFSSRSASVCGAVTGAA